MTRRIFLIAGEASGDLIGAGLMRALKEGPEPVEISGIGGSLMEKEGLKSLLPMDELCVMGIWEVAGHLPRLLKLIQGVVEEIEKQDLDAVVTIDLPDFNFQVAKRLKKRGISRAKLIHYVAPSVWAWRPKRAKKISAFLDGLICLFPFEPAYFTPHGLKAEFVGHPLVEMGLDKADGAAFRLKNRIGADEKILGLFLGSRPSELKKMGETLREVAIVMREQIPGLNIVVPTLPHLEYDILRLVAKWDFPVIVVSNQDLKWDSFAACDIALAVSGTVGLELAYMGVPHVIAYKFHPLSWMFIKRMIRIKYAHLCNLLLDKPVVPEYLQNQCKSLEISKGLLRLFKKEELQAGQRAEFDLLRPLLGGGEGRTPSQKAAAFIWSLAGK